MPVVTLAGARKTGARCARGFVRAAEGDADVAFWQSIYKPKAAYGGDAITGSVLRLFPYVEPDGTFSRSEFAGSEWVHQPISPALIPRGLSAAQLVLTRHERSDSGSGS